MKKKVSLIRLEHLSLKNKFQNALPPQTQTSSLHSENAQVLAVNCLSVCHPLLPWLQSPCCTLMGWARVSYSCDGPQFCPGILLPHCRKFPYWNVMLLIRSLFKPSTFHFCATFFSKSPMTKDSFHYQTFSFETGSWSQGWFWSSWYFCLHLLSAGITGICYCAHLSFSPNF